MISLRLERKKIGVAVVLENAFLQLPTTGFIFLRGPNGGGKTTLLNILAGRDSDYDGSLALDGVGLAGDSLASYADEMISYCPQDALIFDNETALENILVPFPKRDKEKAMAVLEKLGLGKLAKSYAGDLSSGEAQRLAIGRVLYSDRPIALLDEPTSFLDESNASLIMGSLLDYSQAHLVIMSTNEDIPLAYSDYPVINIEDKSVSFISPECAKPDYSAPRAAGKERGKLRSRFNENRLFLFLLAFLNSAFLACSVFFGGLLTTQASDVFRAYWLDYRRPDYSKLAFAESAPILPDNGMIEYSDTPFSVFNIAQYRIEVPLLGDSLSSFDILSFVTVDEFDWSALSSGDYSFLVGAFPSNENEIALPESSYLLLCDCLGIDSPLSEGSFASVSDHLSFNLEYGRGVTLTLSGVFECPEPTGLEEVSGFGAGQSSFIRAYFFPSTHAVLNLFSLTGSLSGGSFVPNTEYNREAFIDSDYFLDIDFLLLDKKGEVARPLNYFTGSNYVAFYLFLSLSMIATLSISLVYCAQNRNRFLLLRLAGAKRDSLFHPRLLWFCAAMAFSVLLGTFIGLGALYVYQSYFLSKLVIAGVGFLRIGADAILFPFVVALLDSETIAALLAFNLFPKDTSRIIAKAKEK